MLSYCTPEEQSVIDQESSDILFVVVAKYITSFHMQEIHVSSSCQQRELTV
jgi:hypothetical protein